MLRSCKVKQENGKLKKLIIFHLRNDPVWSDMGVTAFQIVSANALLKEV